MAIAALRGGPNRGMPSPQAPVVQKSMWPFLTKRRYPPGKIPWESPKGRWLEEEMWRRVLWALHPPWGQSWSASWKHHQPGGAPGIGKAHCQNHLLTIMRCGWNGGPTSWIHPTGGRSWSPYLMWVIPKGWLQKSTPPLKCHESDAKPSGTIANILHPLHQNVSNGVYSWWMPTPTCPIRISAWNHCGGPWCMHRPFNAGKRRPIYWCLVNPTVWQWAYMN